MTDDHKLNGHDPQPGEISEQDRAAYTAAILEALPGLTGAIDMALKDHMGHPVAFVLVTFGIGGASFTSNISDGDEMRRALHVTVNEMVETAAAAKEQAQ